MSVRGDDGNGKKTLSALRENWRRIIDERLAKVLGSSFRQQILWILNERIASPTELSIELDASMNKVCHHVMMLKKAKCIELVGERPVGNAVEHFYKATARAFLEDMEWPLVPDTAKVGLRATLLKNVLNDAVAAVVNEIYDSYEDSHMSWTPMLLDSQGRQEVARLLEESLLETIAIQERAKARLASGDTPGVSYTVSILGYPSVGGKKKVGPPIEATELASSGSSQARDAVKASKKKGTKARGKKTTKGRAGKAKGKVSPKSKRKDASK